MVQQMAMYDQGCKLMVCAPPSHVQTNGITLLNRMQVSMLSPFGDKYLKQSSYS